MSYSCLEILLNELCNEIPDLTIHSGCLSDTPHPAVDSKNRLYEIDNYKAIRIFTTHRNLDPEIFSTEKTGKYSVEYGFIRLVVVSTILKPLSDPTFTYNYFKEEFLKFYSAIDTPIETLEQLKEICNKNNIKYDKYT